MKNFNPRIIFVFAILFSFSNSAIVYAQSAESQILSVTPPLFQLSAVSGDIWQSSVKVVNGNKYPLTVYTEVVNFRATGESGQGKFIPIQDSNEKSTLASWITISKGPHLIPPEQTTEVSFFVEVPDDAPPGGHYAAILVSTEEPKNTEDKLAVKTSQAVTSLFFVRIEGDVKEEGSIREFRVSDSMVPTTNAEFSLRFENKGNVHLQPRGDIIITNMWGAPRGKIPVNYQTHFGNVLPMSIRDFKFSWNSDFRISDVGRYKAVATLAYGEGEIKSTSAVTYFWVVPIKATLITLTIIVIFIGFIVWMIKLYVRKMLMLAGVDVVSVKGSATGIPVDKLSKKDSQIQLSRMSYRAVAAPLRTGVLDLRRELSQVDESIGVLKTLVTFVRHYKLFFISVFILIGIFTTIVIYIKTSISENQNYEVIIENEGSKTIIDSSDLHEE